MPKRPICPVCGRSLVSTYVYQRKAWVKVGGYCKKCRTTVSLDKQVIVV